MKKMRSILFAFVLVVACTTGFLFGHGDVAAFDFSGDLSSDLSASATKSRSYCPGGGSPKCVQCWGPDCNWSCRGGFYCYNTSSGACAVGGVSCGRTLSLYSSFYGIW